MARHRGPQPDDWRLFSPEIVPRLRQATADLCWLLSRGYALPSARRLVGDHFQLTARQRLAIERCCCSDQVASDRKQRLRSLLELRGLPIAIDGYNVLITLECALAGGFLFRGRDGAIRDIASLHGSWRRVQETTQAVRLVAETLYKNGIKGVTWFLDAPVSNSGRLAALLRETSSSLGLDWLVNLTNNPDRALIASGLPVVTSDSWILDNTSIWVNLIAEILPALSPPPPLIDLG